MAQENKICPKCSEKGHSGFYCKNTPRKPMRDSGKPARSIKVKVPVKKKKAPTRSQLVKKLDDIYSKYVRLDQSDEFGYCICVTSGERMFWKEAQNGHFFSRRFYPTRWNDDNCHPQSMRDNVFLKGNYINYTRYMIDSYGRDFVDELEKLAHTTIKVKNAELIEKIAYYSTEVERLKHEKGL